MRYHLELSKESKKMIYEIMINDYTMQLGQHKRNKHNFDYKDYRHIYVRLHNHIQHLKKQITKLGE